MSFLLGMSGIIWGLYFVFTYPDKGFTGYWDPPGFVLLSVLPPSIMLLSHNVSDLFTGIQTLMSSMFHNTNQKHYSVINSLTTCSAKVRSEGVGSLVAERRKLEYDLLIDGVSLIINNFTDEEIRHNLYAKINSRQSRIQNASNLFENMARVSPGVGMIGTLMGLIRMMSHISDPSTIGGGMALALITTLYGLVLGNIIYAPFGEKIAIEGDKIHKIDLLVLEGVLALKGKKSSIHMKDIMQTYSGKKRPT